MEPNEQSICWFWQNHWQDERRDFYGERNFKKIYQSKFFHNAEQKKETRKL